MLSIAIIGAGRIGQVHARSVSNHPEARLVLVCDPVGEAAERLADQYGSRSCKEPSEVFADPEVDAVIIGSPTSLHLPQLIAAAKAGKAVLCEKPVAQQTSQVEAVQDELDQITTPVMFGFNRRFDPSFAAAKKAVEDGSIGELEQLTIISRDPAAPPAEYVRGSGGIFRDMTIHDFDMARHFLGEIVEVNATGQNFVPEIKAAGDFDAAVVVLTAENGQVATIINNRRCASGYDQRLEAAGSAGAVFVENVRPNAARISSALSTNAEAPYLDFFLDRYEAAYTHELGEFIKAVASGASPEPGLRDAVEALRIADAATVSAREGHPVRLQS